MPYDEPSQMIKMVSRLINDGKEENRRNAFRRSQSATKVKQYYQTVSTNKNDSGKWQRYESPKVSPFKEP